jgi:hypothetical protein
MKKLIFIIIFLSGFVFVNKSYAECGCTTSTPIPTLLPTETPQPISTPNMQPTPQTNSQPNGQVGAPICTASQPSAPIITSVIRGSTTATLTWTKIDPVSYYFIFYGTSPRSQQFGIPNVGNVTTYIIGALNPKLKYYFDVRAVNDCQPSNSSNTGQVLGASTTRLASTGSNLLLSRLIFAIISGGVFFFLAKKTTI